ncbi:gibberellin 20 oxidase 1-B [Cocos nucifera]|uniref:Gibberellin 20 oxidase 1-B n=1 Tax=Cocos nucifera TaxID=13894 RepID=A0A8K0ILZ1_COCNU|nr:gibberellin 20 oxidase 1-B [Cocos nucifera]
MKAGGMEIAGGGTGDRVGTGEKEANDLTEPSGCSITFLTKIQVEQNMNENTLSSLSSQPDSGDLSKLADSSDIVQEYGSKMMELSKKIVVVLLKCLGDRLEFKYLDEFSQCHGYLRINNYTPPEDIEAEGVEGLGMHTDMSCITILYQDATGGLQMRSKEGDWVDLLSNEDALAVNIGDLLQAWSNGQLRSSKHRVILKQPVNRLSVAFFWCFEDEKVILAPEDVVGGRKHRIYKPFVCLDYIKFRENTEKGRFDKVGYNINGFAAISALNYDENMPT